MAPIIYCFCSNCSCPATALITLVTSYQRDKDAPDYQTMSRPASLADMEKNNSNIRSNIESAIVIMLLVFLMLGM